MSLFHPPYCRKEKGIKSKETIGNGVGEGRNGTFFFELERTVKEN